MSLGPDQLRPFEAGDRIRVSGEVQVSTTCVARGPRCVGRPTSSTRRSAPASSSPNTQEPVGASIPLSEPRSVLCKQRRPNRNHHCTLVFGNLETSITDLAALPCPADACYVNLIVGASHRNARGGNGSSSGPTVPTAASSGQGPAQRRPGGPRCAGADRAGERGPAQRGAAADRGQEAEAPCDPFGADPGAAQERGARLRRRLRGGHRTAAVQHLSLRPGDRRGDPTSIEPTGVRRARSSSAAMPPRPTGSTAPRVKRLSDALHGGEGRCDQVTATRPTRRRGSRPPCIST